jgi:hypothetical protein
MNTCCHVFQCAQIALLHAVKVTSYRPLAPTCRLRHQLSPSPHLRAFGSHERHVNKSLFIHAVVCFINLLFQDPASFTEFLHIKSYILRCFNCNDLTDIAPNYIWEWFRMARGKYLDCDTVNYVKVQSPHSTEESKKNHGVSEYRIFQ